MNGNMFKKNMFILPYIIVFIIWIMLYFIAGKLSNINLKWLMINLSSSFFAVLLLYISYEVSRNYTNQQLYKSISDYVKLKVDSEIISMINQTRKYVYEIDKIDHTLLWINNFLTLHSDEIEHIFKKSEYLWFQIFKHWKVIEDNIEKNLNSNIFLTKMSNEQVISLINILKNIKLINDILSYKNKVYILKSEENIKYVVYFGAWMNEYKWMHLLWEKMWNNKIKVVDFGFIEEWFWYEKKLLKKYKINDQYIAQLSNAVYNLNQSIIWRIKLTGTELIIDDRLFRIIDNRVLQTNKLI